MSKYLWTRMFAVVLSGLAGISMAPVALAACTYSVTLSSPANGASYVAPANVSLAADADGYPDGCTVSTVKFYNGATLLAQVSRGTDGMFSYAWSGVGVGSYAIKAQTGTGTAQVTANITVTASQPPNVSMAAPTGSPFIAPATLGLSATASDADGTVTKVEFFQGSTLISTDTSAPYQASFNASTAGTYSFTAKATDSTGQTKTSSAVSTTVVNTSVIGNVDDLDFVSPDYKLYGWACSTGRNQSLSVHMYAGGAYGTGTLVGAYTANQASEAAIATSCQAQGIAYRFAITLTPAIRQQFANQKIYVYGISPEGLSNNLLAASGVLSIPPPLSLTRTYVYNSYQELCQVVEPEVGTTLMGYDAAGNLSWSASGYNPISGCAQSSWVGARRVDRTYDGRNRLRNLTFPDGRGNQLWSYTPDGLPSAITTYNETGNTAGVVNGYAYNRRRLMTGESVAQPGWYTWSIGYDYNANGVLQGNTYPTGLYVDYAPNALGQPTRAGTYATGVKYYPNGGIKQFTYGNGIIHTMTQNTRQLPARSTDAGGALDHEYGYDENGNVEFILDRAQGAGYDRWLGYDPLDRLISAESVNFGGSDHVHRFTYDALNNLRSWKLAGVKDYASYYYDARNRLSNIENSSGSSVVGLAYDLQGNLQAKDGQGYVFDYGNRLREATGKESYRYDGHGRRVETIKNGGAQQLFQYSRSGQYLFGWKGPTVQSTQEFVYLGGSLVATIEHAWPGNTITAIKYQHTDALGSPVAVSNESAQVIERTQYEPYGGAGNRDGVGYAGHVMDGATGLTYMQQRYYDSQIGRFLSVDPVAAGSGTGASFNRYWYANNNPYRFADPDGRLACSVVDKQCFEQRQGLNRRHMPVLAVGSADSQIKNRHLPNGEPPAGPFEPAETKGEVIQNGIVQRNDVVKSNIDRLRAAMDMKGYKWTPLIVTGGESYVGNDGKVRSVTDGSLIPNRLSNSAHNVENGSRAIDLRAISISHKTFMNIVRTYTNFTNNTNDYADRHEHLGLPNRPEFSCAATTCTEP